MKMERILVNRGSASLRGSRAISGDRTRVSRVLYMAAVAAIRANPARSPRW